MKKKEALDRENRRIDQKRTQLKTQQTKLRAFREARIKRGALVQGAANAGVQSSGTSGIQGGTASITSQLGQNIGQLGSFSNFSSKISDLSQQSADALSKFNRIGSKADTLNSIFKGVSTIAQAGGQAYAA
jgi:hypothetical protein